MRRILFMLLAAAVLAGCAGDRTDTGDGGDGHMRSGHGGAPSASQALVDADRTVRITTDDALRFSPATLSVKQGDTIAFEVTNPGKTAHEFVVGDQAFQDRHHEEMAGQTMPMHDSADGIGLPAGATKTLVYTFEQPSTLLYACHVAGHYGAGMKGTITVS